MRIDTVVWSVELRENWFFPKFKCKISFFNIWEPKISQLIVIGSHWGFAGCSLVSHWGSLRVIWWSFWGHFRFLKKLNFDFGNKFDFLICHSVVINIGQVSPTQSLSSWDWTELLVPITSNQGLPCPVCLKNEY